MHTFSLIGTWFANYNFAKDMAECYIVQYQCDRIFSHPALLVQYLRSPKTGIGKAHLKDNSKKLFNAPTDELLTPENLLYKNQCGSTLSWKRK